MPNPSKLAHSYTTPDFELIRARLAPFGVPVSDRLARDIAVYCDLLNRWNRKLNLTALESIREILSLHFGESMFAVGVAGIEDGRLADVGSGAGFPGIPIKFLVPRLDLSLFEARERKSAFLLEVCRQLHLQQTKVYTQRFGANPGQDPVFDWITIRALQPSRKLLSACSSRLTPSGKLLIWSSAGVMDELFRYPGWTWARPVPLPLSREKVIAIGEPRR